VIAGDYHRAAGSDVREHRAMGLWAERTDTDAVIFEEFPFRHFNASYSIDDGEVHGVSSHDTHRELQYGQ
jgi:hypothetical protein